MKLKKSHLHRAGRIVTCVMMACLLVATSMSDADAARKKKGTTKGKRPAAAKVLGVNDPRYAAIIMNPVTGEVYHAANADAKRYPASLTKMMTLYLLFEALANDKTSLNAHLDISDYATTMPQTHLSLRSGDTIPVEVAIKALVVRSANDVSVVVAEALGGDVDNFARMMTNKARQLGMKNTVFKNPNGLPNGGQYTTARDMAKLGIALKRDFPQYYDYFATRQFSWNGVTYYTHNRVMLRYPGTDGIKTGYIGLSGFNVVSSVTRGGRPLMGTVMGGASGGWRDNRMIQLLDESYKIIASRGAVRGKLYPENLPLQKDAKTGKMVGRGINAKPVFGMDANEYAETLPADQVKTPGDGSAEDAMYDDADDGSAGNEPASPFAVAEVAKPQVAAPATVAHPAPVVIQVPQTPAPAPAVAPAPVAAPVPETHPPGTITTTAVDPAKPNYIRIVSVPPKETAAAPKPAAPAPQAAPIQKPVVTAPVIATPITPTTPATPVVTPIVSKPAATAAAPATAAPAQLTAQQVTTPQPATPGAVWGIQVGAFSSNDQAVRAVNGAYAVAKPTLSGARMSVAGPDTGGAPVHRARIVNITEKQAKDTCKTLIAHSTPCMAFKNY